MFEAEKAGELDALPPRGAAPPSLQVGGIQPVTQLLWSALQVRFEKLQDIQDLVRAVCTDAVYAPYSMAVYELALVNAKTLVCDTAAACRKAGVPEHMQNALDQQAQIQTALEATH